MATKKIAKLLIEIGIKTKGVNKQFDKINKSMGTFGKKSSKLGSIGAMAARGMVALGAAAVTGIGIAVKKSSEFNQEMKRVQAITQASEQDFKKLNSAAIELSNKMGIASHDVAEGMKEMAKFGFDAQKIMETMPHVLNATIASGEEFGTVLKVTEGLLSEFGMKASETERVVDTLTKISFETRANISRMGEAFKFSAPVAKQLGVEMRDLAAATGLMINAGVEGGLAGRSLRKVMMSLAAPTMKAEEKLEELNIQVKDSKDNMLPLIKIIENVANATQGMGNTQKAAALKTIFGIEAVSGMMALLEKGPAEIQALSNKIKDAGGITAETAEIMNDTLIGSLNKLQQRINNLLIEIGTKFEPGIKAIADSLNELLDGINFDIVMESVSEFIENLMQFLNDSGFVGNFIKIWNALKGHLISLWTGISNFFHSTLSQIMSWWNEHGDSITAAIKKVVSWIVDFWTENWETIATVIKAVWPVISTIIQMFLDVIMFAIAAFSAVINGDWKKLWEAIKKYTSNVFSNIGKLIVNALKGIAKLALLWGANIIQGLIDGIMSKVTAVGAAVGSVARKISNFLGASSPTKSGPLSVSDKWMPNLMDMLQKGIEMGIPKVQSAVMDVAATIGSGINGASGDSRNVTSTNNVNIYPQQANLNSKQLMRELNRVAWMQGGML